VDLPQSGTVFLSVRERDKPSLIDLARSLEEMGYELIATKGTADFLAERGIAVRVVKKVLEGSRHIVDEMQDGDVQILINTTEGLQAIRDSYSLRRAAITNNIPYYTTMAGARAVVKALAAIRTGDLEVAPLQAYFD